MKRGVIELTIFEINAIVQKFHLENYSSRPIADKLAAAVDAKTENIRVELSEDELEIVLDEVGIPEETDSIELKEARKKMQTMLVNFRK